MESYLFSTTAFYDNFYDIISLSRFFQERQNSPTPPHPGLTTISQSFVEYSNFLVYWLPVYPVGLPSGTVVQNLPAKVGDEEDVGSMPGSGRSPGGGNGNPHQYSCL